MDGAAKQERRTARYEQCSLVWGFRPASDFPAKPCVKGQLGLAGLCQIPSTSENKNRNHTQSHFDLSPSSGILIVSGSSSERRGSEESALPAEGLAILVPLDRGQEGADLHGLQRDGGKVQPVGGGAVCGNGAWGDRREE